MRILAIESSNRTLSVALMENQKLLAEWTVNEKLQHATELMPAIERVCQVTQTAPQAIEQIVVAKGPGSYTGLRIGGTAAKIMADVLRVPLIPVSSLAVLAGNALARVSSSDVLIVPYMDARREAVYTGAYRYENEQLINVIPDQYVTREEWINQLKEQQAPLYFVGEHPEWFEANFEVAQHHLTVDAYPKAHHLVQLSYQEQAVDPKTFVPDYLKTVEAEEKWQQSHPNLVVNEYVRYV
ncbi:tRNA (adenosine(37)-N6)-threonylcarbamoyltransferase complex dimerization subunit type 1 TsaB [Atopobacter phocae]|uniref:tRNA (adenosine(37)-N6)-threonylcarbamoyltransferase complex dimerization subunit type 1 TsaB n=1 Tax=Atopobacter phocae TaxID=136492 RepID=UPI0004725981|nr:tRNA (adenosine(37)-N6)-threonylcarbamoyltransferase complex dimerization subunit type 1 TsaB [Atopobacter phocae]